MTAKRNRCQRLQSAAVIFLSLSGCTYGGVTDAATGEFLGAAQVEFRVVVPPTSTPTDHLWPEVELGDSYVARTWSASDPGSQGVQGIYYLNPAAPDGETDPAVRVVQGGWNAVVVSKTGYDTRRVYRNHTYLPCSMGTKNPYSAGPYPFEPVDTSDPSQVEEGWCKEESFQLHGTGTSYDKKPDLIVDARSLLDRALAPCDRAFEPRTCLKVITSTPNVGDGDLLLVAPFTTLDGDELGAAEPVQQVIARTDGTFTEVPVGGQFFMEASQNIHRFTGTDAWVTLRLRKYDAEVCPHEANASSCPVERENQISLGHCLYDASTFDAQYTPARSHSGCSLETRHLHNGGIYFREGIGAGRAQPIRLGGDQVDITDLPPGDYWLEAEVNADGTIVESDYENNVARVLIQL